jgi:hypothetical protein
MIAHADFIVILGACLSETKVGRNLKGLLPTLTGQTLRGYIKGVTTVLRPLLTGHPCSSFDAATLHQSAPCTSSLLGGTAELACCVACAEAEEGTRYFVYVRCAQASPDREVRLCQKHLPTFLSQEYDCYDWTRLGMFTGSRISKYGQSKIPWDAQYATVLSIEDAGMSGRVLPLLLSKVISQYQNDFTDFSPSKHYQILSGKPSS